jgi:Asp-tRNA(Asn)/Glu-tRNA(Gln) amidotransferase C subunit
MDQLELIRDILGLEVDAERQETVLTAYRDVLREIEKLRTLDLTDVHPAVVFTPTTNFGADV